MEVTEILERYSDDDDDNDCDIPDNVIYVIFPESDILEKAVSSLSEIHIDEFIENSLEEEQKLLISPTSDLFSINDKCDDLTFEEFGFHDDFILDVSNFINKENKRDVGVQTVDSDDIRKISGNDNLLKYAYCDDKATKIPDIKLDISEKCKSVTSDLSNEIESVNQNDEMEKKRNHEFEVLEDQTYPVIDSGSSSAQDKNVKKDGSNASLSRKVKKKQKRIKNLFIMKCKHCDLEFSTFSSLQKHSKLEHNSTDFSLPCNICGQSFTRPHNLSRHKETRHREGDKKYECEHCGRKFGRQDIFTSHLRLMHSTDQTTSMKANRLHQCSSCKKFFAKLHNYKKHLEGNLSCIKCSLSFSCKRSYREHLNKQHSVTCDICSKTCQSKQQMYAHKLTHTPKFKCEYCGKGFIWESSYIIHLATHTGIRPVNCDVCGKSFAHANAVKKHKWQEHTEANRKHCCKLCGKSFVYKAKLENHIRIHSGKRPFPCQLCSSYFSQQRNLIAHMRVIHGTLEDSVMEIEEKSEKHKDEVGDGDDDEIQTGSVQIQLSDQLTLQELPVDDFQTFEELPIDNLSSDGLIIKGLDSDIPIYQIIYNYPSCIE